MSFIVNYSNVRQAGSREKEREVMLDVGDVIPGLAGPDCVTAWTLQGSGLHPGSPVRGELSLQKKKVMHAGESAVIFTAQRSRTKAFQGSVRELHV